MFSAEELERYARHIVLPDVGGPGQAALSRARVLVVGAGGLGAPVLLYLAAAGVGTLGVVDDDVVTLSNLQRQVIHATPDIGTSKVDSAAAMIHRLNPHVAVEQHPVRLTAQNALALIERYDLIADGSDNFATRYLVADACYFAAQAAGDRRAWTIRRHADDDPRARTRRRRQTQSDLSVSVSRAAAARHSTGLRRGRDSWRVGRRDRLNGRARSASARSSASAKGLVGRLIMLDARAMRFETLRYEWDPANPLSGDQPTIRDLSGHF